jgi:hypothetical protein
MRGGTVGYGEEVEVVQFGSRVRPVEQEILRFA